MMSPEGDTHEENHSRHRSRRDLERAAGLCRQFDHHPQSLCTAHKETDGIKKIESALTLIGVKPMVKG
jgi:hypothetical protein